MANAKKKHVLTQMLESCANEIKVPRDMLMKILKRIDESKNKGYN